MKLSEAIRIGAKTGPQAFGVSVDGKRTCALGAALVAIGQANKSYTDIGDFFPLAVSIVRHPLMDDDEDWLMFSVIRDLNDGRRWTRARIAKWVARIERKAGA